MRQRTDFVPDVMPHLSAGRHRNPRRGACFMEFASYLAGERWSDHPACTDRTLAALARGVNDLVADDRRDELVTLIPRVVGLRGDERPRAARRPARRRSSRCRSPAWSASGRSPPACSSLCALLEMNAGSPRQAIRAEAQQALDAVPDAARWAHDAHPHRVAALPRTSTPSARELIVATAVVGRRPGLRPRPRRPAHPHAVARRSTTSSASSDRADAAFEPVRARDASPEGALV